MSNLVHYQEGLALSNSFSASIEHEVCDVNDRESLVLRGSSFKIFKVSFYPFVNKSKTFQMRSFYKVQVRDMIGKVQKF